MKPVFVGVGEGIDRRDIAVRHRPGGTPGVMWLGGYRSDMLGTKAAALEDWAVSRRLACCRHDYSGHGESGGEFMEGTISRWLEESLAVFDTYASERQILVGSSMGAWIALRMAQELTRRGIADRLHGILLLAPAPDFTHELMMPKLSEEERATIEQNGYLEKPSEYSDQPDIYTQNLFVDGDNNRVMTGPIDLQCPIHIMQGMMDEDVPYLHALKLMTYLPDTNATITLVKDGDHRLSRDKDIDLMCRLLETIADIE